MLVFQTQEDREERANRTYKPKVSTSSFVFSAEVPPPVTASLVLTLVFP